MSSTRRCKHRRGWSAALVVGALALAMVSAPPATAATAGDLDNTFDGNGSAVTDVFGGAEDRVNAIAVQADGKVVAVGTWGTISVRSNFALVRYNPDGSVDESFGSGGRVLTDFDGDDDHANGVAIQPDGKIVVVGSARIQNKPFDFAIARYTTAGKLDPTFNNDGRMTFGFNSYDQAFDVAIQSDWRIVVVGRRYGNNVPADFALARITPFGELDTSFSDDGKVMTGFGGSDSAHAVALQRDNKIVAAGVRVDNDANDRDFAVARYTWNGKLDRTFDNDGKLTTGLGEHDVAYDVAIQSDGRIVAAGWKGARPPGIAANIGVTRYHANGDLDSSLDDDGKLTVDLGDHEWANSVALQSDGKILLGGVSEELSSNPYRYTDYFVARLNWSGTLDRTFSGDGRMISGVSESDGITDLAVQSDGKILAGGYSHDGPSRDDSDFTAWRFHARTE